MEIERVCVRDRGGEQSPTESGKLGFSCLRISYLFPIIYHEH